MTKFDTILKREKELTDQALHQLVEANKLELNSPEFEQIWQVATKMLLTGGKRLRPLLVRLGYGLASPDLNPDFDLVKASCFIEIIHCYLLIHDDIADRDYLRYGQDSVEVQLKKYLESYQADEQLTDHLGRSFAMVAGDVIHALAYRSLEDLPGNKVKSQIQLMTETQLKVAAGWSLHLRQNLESLATADIDEYLQGLYLVSSSYSIEAPLLLGLDLAENNQLDLQLIRQFARHAGTAFQLQDDLLGVFGQSQTMGKPVGNDLREAKKTPLVLLSYRNSDADTRQYLSSTIGNQITSEQIKQIQAIIKESGAYQKTQELIKSESELALELLSKLPDTPAKSRLRQLLDFLSKRDR